MQVGKCVAVLARKNVFTFSRLKKIIILLLSGMRFFFLFNLTFFTEVYANTVSAFCKLQIIL